MSAFFSSIIDMIQTPSTDHYFDHFINNNSIPSKKLFLVRNPLTNTPIASVSDGNKAESRYCVDAAASAFEEWKTLPISPSDVRKELYYFTAIFPRPFGYDRLKKEKDSYEHAGRSSACVQKHNF